MCGTCGCGAESPDWVEGPGPLADKHEHGHDHEPGEAGASAARLLRVEQDLLAINNGYAAANRAFFQRQGMLCLNLVSSPGSGKTTLLVRTVSALKEDLPVAVVEGDQQTSNDSERIRAAGVPGIQINTGKGCHLDAHRVGHAVTELGPLAGGVLFIENVGNLVCPAAFDLGEAHKVVIISVTEGEDKPLKYPDMFAAADLMIVNKIDLLPYLEFDVERCVGYARRVNPRIEPLRLSAATGEGCDQWLAWLRSELDAARGSAVEARQTAAST